MVMSTTLNGRGRLGNQIIRNLCMSIVAEKNDLDVNYENYEKINKLINLYKGSNIFGDMVELNEDNFFEILNLGRNSLKSNLDGHYSFFQTRIITNFLYNYLNSICIRNQIIKKNPYKDRYNSNNDCYIHVRIGDVECWSPGIDYYTNALRLIKFDKLYISSDTLDHNIVNTLIDNYPNSEKVLRDDIDTIHFASTCKYLILSHGSFSAIIGYLGFFSEVYYKSYDVNGLWWHGDIFSIPGWKGI